MLIDSGTFLLAIAGSLAGVRTRNTGHSGTLIARSPEPPLITATRPALTSTQTMVTMLRRSSPVTPRTLPSKIEFTDNVARWMGNGDTTYFGLVPPVTQYATRTSGDGRTLGARATALHDTGVISVNRTAGAL
ncbi:unnamed protein product, partial [Brenthis ino]